jgi:hypothetical protein
MAIVKQRAIIPLTVSIKEESIAKLVPAGSSTPVADALSARCSQYLEVTADGGLVLRSEELSEIEKNWGKQIRSGQDVVKATMIKAGRTEEGQTRFEGYLDPVWTEPLKVLALESGRSVDELVREVYEMALENNWLYGFKFEGSRHTISTANEKFLASRIDGTLTIDKVVAYIRELEKTAKKVNTELAIA